MKWFLWDVWNLLTDWGFPILTAVVFYLLIVFVGLKVGEGIKTFAQDVHTIAESIESER